MASATPSVETFYQAKRGKIHLFTLSRRYLGSQLPKVQIVDMKQSFGFDISQELTAELADNLQAGQQSIVLLNRRGYHTAVRCNQCGEVLKCPNCSVALTYHSANHRLMCHYLRLLPPAGPELPELRQQPDQLHRQRYPAHRGRAAPHLSAGQHPADGHGHHHVPHGARRQNLTTLHRENIRSWSAPRWWPRG